MVELKDKTQVKKKMHQLLKMTTDFCGEYLDEEYKQLCEKLIRKMARKRNVPFLSGRMTIWAAAIIYALGRINFLFGNSTAPYVSTNDICDFFSTNKGTTSQKAKHIIDMFKMRYWDKEFSTEHTKKSDPSANIILVDGIPFHINALPTEIKEILLLNQQTQDKLKNGTRTRAFENDVIIQNNTFSTSETNKTKSDWFLNEYANAVFEWLSDCVDSFTNKRRPISVQNLKKFSITIAKKIVPRITQNEYNKIILPEISKELVLNTLNKRLPAHIIEEFVEILKHLLETQIDTCQSCPTQCLSDFIGKSYLFNTGSY